MLKSFLLSERSTRIFILIFFAGISWAVSSDILISLFENGIASFYLECLRAFNNCLLFGLTALLLYWYIRKQKDKLKQSKEQYYSLFKTNPNPMWAFHMETYQFMDINDAAVIKYGYSREEFLNLTIWDIRPAEDYELLEEAIKVSVPLTRDVGIWRHIKKSGEIFPVSIVSHDVTLNQQPCRMVMVTDMTDIINKEKKLQEAFIQEKELREKLAENYEQLKKSEQESRVMAQVMDKINNLVIIIGEDSTISWVNQAFCNFTGYCLDELTGKSPGEVLFGPQTDLQTIEHLREAIGHQLSFSDELVNYKKNGEPYWSQIYISPIFDEAGKLQFFVSVENVITERKYKEQKIITQHTILQEIAWSNSHELRRPVCSIQGLISVLKEATTEEEKNECLALLEHSSNELDQILQNTNHKIRQLELNETLPLKYH